MSIISIKDLSFKYKKGHKEALSNINLDIERGEMLAVMGSTGAGKSTLCTTFNGLIPHLIKGDLKGSVRICGMETKMSSVSELSKLVGLVFQDFESQIFSTNVELEVAFGLENHGIEPGEMHSRIASAISVTGLSGLEPREPATLSGGEKQRLAIASILAMRPHVICLDEPTTDLDPQGREEVIKIAAGLRKEGSSLIIVGHEAEEVAGADKLLLMRDGKVIGYGKAEKIFKTPELLKDAGIMPLQVTELFSEAGEEERPIEIDEAEKLIRTMGWGFAPDILEQRDKEAEKGLGDAIVEIKGVSHIYNNGTSAIEDISLTIRRGEFLAILGHNGSGKTTLIKEINGLLTPKKGDIYIEGADAKRLGIEGISKKVGYVFQNPDHQIFCERVYDEIAFGLRPLSHQEEKRRVSEALLAVGLQGKEDEDPFILTKGERQRIAVASVLSQRPSLLILDEPTTGLDYKDILGMMELLKRLNEKGHTIIIVTHSMWVAAEYAKRIVIMSRGRIVMDNTPREIFSKDRELEALSLRAPEITRLSRRFGFTALSVKEFIDSIQSGKEERRG